MLPSYPLNSSLTKSQIVTLQLHRHSGTYKSCFGFSTFGITFLQENLHQYLLAAELEQYQSFKFQNRQHTFLHGRFLAKKVIAHYLGESDLQNFHIKSGVFEQPLVMHASADKPAISISHTATHAVCLAFPEEHPMAIDIEMITGKTTEHIGSQLTAFERTLNHSRLEEENVFYTRIWTIKEALSKVLKTGLMTPMEIYEVSSLKFLPYQGYFESSFTNFSQYKAISFPLKNNICSIVLPKQTNMPVILTDDF